MASLALSFRNTAGAGSLHSRPANLGAAARKTIDDLTRKITDRFFRTARQRNAKQAMIASHPTVRNIARLIALPSHRPVPHNDNVRDFFSGFREEEPLCFKRGTGQGRSSAVSSPQHCGKQTATLFDVDGLIDWLRNRYPRSTTFCVEADTGIPAASVENWLHRRSQPSVQHFSVLLYVYGPPFLSACFRSTASWIDEAARNHRRREIEAEIARLENEMRGAA
jgi:hypothetical protein